MHSDAHCNLHQVVLTMSMCLNALTGSLESFVNDHLSRCTSHGWMSVLRYIFTKV